MEKRRLGIVGTGKLGSIILKAYKDGFLDGYELVGILGRDKERTETAAKEVGTTAFYSVDDFLQQKPEYIAEAASVAFVKEHAEHILSSGSNLVLLSIGAFADQEFYKKIGRTALEAGTRVYLASGAIGGFDVLRTATLIGEATGKATAHIRAQKRAPVFVGTPFYSEELYEKGKIVKVFEGNAKEAIAVLPRQVNVTVAAGLATVGPEDIQVEIISDETLVGDDHVITVEADGVKAIVDVYGRDAALPAWSAVERLRNILSPIVF